MQNLNNETTNTSEKKLEKNNISQSFNKDKDFLPEDDTELVQKFLQELTARSGHFGHPIYNSQAKKANFVLYKLNGCNIINLDKTLDSLRVALKLVFNVINKGEKILFLTTNRNLKEIFKETANQCGAPYICNERYQPGTFTNNQHFLEKKKVMESSIASSSIDMTLTKKERNVIINKRRRTERYFEGLGALNDMPKLVITVGGEKEYKTVIAEAQAMNIGVISFNDIDVRPVSGYNAVTIPCNTKSVEAIQYLLQYISVIILRAYEEYLIHNKKKIQINHDGQHVHKSIEEASQKMIDDIVAKSATLAQAEKSEN